MDLVTHGLLGTAVGLARRRPSAVPTDTDRAAVWAAILGAMAPDTDLVFRWLTQAYGLRYHRGLTHSLPGVFILSLVVAGVVKLFFRRARLLTLYIWSLLSMLLCHVLIDLLNTYGNRVLLPWTNRYFSWDIISEIDLFFTLPLFAGMIFAIFWRKRQRQIVMLAIFYALAYYAFHTYMHLDLMKTVKEEITAGQPAQAVSLLAGPRHFITRWYLGQNPLTWRYIVEYPDYYLVGEAIFPRKVMRPERIDKQPADAVIEAAKTDRIAREFLSFARHPLIDYWVENGEYLVRLRDVRGLLANGDAEWMAYVRLDGNLNVISSSALGF